MSDRNVFVLYAFDPTTGCASRPVGVVGTEMSVERTPHAHVSWIPLERSAAAMWRERVGLSERPLYDVIDEWLDAVNGVTSDMELVETEQTGDLATVVEAVVDELLSTVVEG